MVSEDRAIANSCLALRCRTGQGVAQNIAGRGLPLLCRGKELHTASTAWISCCACEVCLPWLGAGKEKRFKPEHSVTQGEKHQKMSVAENGAILCYMGQWGGGTTKGAISGLADGPLPGAALPSEATWGRHSSWAGPAATGERQHERSWPQQGVSCSTATPCWMGGLWFCSEVLLGLGFASNRAYVLCGCVYVCFSMSWKTLFALFGLSGHHFSKGGERRNRPAYPTPPPMPTNEVLCGHRPNLFLMP